MKNFIFTVDVESFSFKPNNYDDKVIYRLENNAMPKLLSLRNLSIEMRQIFYLFKQHFLMVNHRFGVYLSTPEHQAF